MRHLITHAIALLAILLAQAGHAVPLHDPQLRWQTLESEHFYIHFHDGEQQLAQQLVTIAEETHRQLSPFLNWQPRQKTDVVLTDRYDVTNGWATVYPNNHMTLLTTPPLETLTLEDYDHWLKRLFVHEYTHILHLDKGEDLPGSLRNVFGRFPLLFPNIFQPRWMTEGLATYVETDTQQGVGRGQSSLYRAMMRLEWQQGIKPLAQLNAYTAEWPMGTSYYLYGVYFQQFIRDRYGEPMIQRLVERYSDNLIPYFLNSNTRRELNQDLAQLWRGFDAYLAERFAPEVEQLNAEGLTPGTAITQTGYRSGNPRLLANGDLYYIEDSPYQYARLMRLAAGQSQPRQVALVRDFQFHAHPQAGVLLIRSDRVNNSNLFKDIYRVDPDTGKQQRLTRGGRYHYAIWAPDGQQIYAIHYQLGQFSLHRLDAEGQLQEVLWQGQDDTAPATLDIDPRGEHLVANIWRPAGRWNLELFDLQQRQWQPLTHTDAIETQPRFSPDGAQIVFSADYGGVYNIHRLTLANGEITRLTNLVGGGFSPSLSADGQTLYYSQLTAQGYDLYHTTAEELPATSAPPARQQAVEITPATLTPKPYRALPRLAPSWWFPYWFFGDNRSEIGLSTSGNDPLWYHSYQLFAAYDLDNQWPLGSFWYRYERWATALQLQLTREKEFYLRNNDDLAKVRDNDSIALWLERPFMYWERQWGLQAGLVYQRDQDRYNAPGSVGWSPFESGLVGLALSYHSGQYYAKSIGELDGRTVNLVTESYRPFGGHYDGQVSRLEWREMLRLGKRQLLNLQLSLGRGHGETEPFRLGGTVSDGLNRPGNAASPSPFNKRRFALPGYDSGYSALRGQHMARLSLDYRFPITRIERTLMAPPIGIQQLYGDLFAFAGDAWNDGQQADWKRSVGVELNGELLLGYLLPLTLTVGYAHGLDDLGSQQFYLTLGGGF